MHVVCVNYFYDRTLSTPDDLLDRYETLTGWAEALASAGARVSVVQRYAVDAGITRNGISYRFVRDWTWKAGGFLDQPRWMHQVVTALNPDLVHVHGLQFASQACQLKSSSNMRSVPILLQDHANLPPRHWLNRWRLRRALRRTDAVSFSAQGLARPWQNGGFLRAQQPVFELMEGSSRFGLQSRGEARARTGMTGDPVCLWVGRLNANKDPLTVLCGFTRALAVLPGARLTMVYSEGELLPLVQSWLAKNPSVLARTTLLGRQPHAALEAVYNSADFFLLGSHHEGSGYAPIEALACGVVPILTDIPSFRILTSQGTVGGLWPIEDADTMARVLIAQYARLQTDTPQRVRAFFDANFSWNVIGRQAMTVYRRLLH